MVNVKSKGGRAQLVQKPPKELNPNRTFKNAAAKKADLVQIRAARVAAKKEKAATKEAAAETADDDNDSGSITKRKRAASASAPASHEPSAPKRAKATGGNKKSATKAQKKKEADSDTDDVSVSSVGTDEFATNKELVKLQTATQNRINKMQKRDKSKPDAGVLYVGRVPHGFYEAQMRGFFSQFGTVEHVRLSRNKKTGKSKHYAFVQFEDKEVAQIVCDAMNNQIVLGSLLQCEVLAPERVHPSMFVGADQPFKAIDFKSQAREAHNTPRSAAHLARRSKRLVNSENAKRAKFAELGIDYDFKGYAEQRIKPKGHKRF